MLIRGGQPLSVTEHWEDTLDDRELVLPALCIIHLAGVRMSDAEYKRWLEEAKNFDHSRKRTSGKYFLAVLWYKGDIDFDVFNGVAILKPAACAFTNNKPRECPVWLQLFSKPHDDPVFRFEHWLNNDPTQDWGDLLPNVWNSLRSALGDAALRYEASVTAPSVVPNEGGRMLRRAPTNELTNVGFKHILIAGTGRKFMEYTMGKLVAGLDRTDYCTELAKQTLAKQQVLEVSHLVGPVTKRLAKTIPPEVSELKTTIRLHRMNGEQRAYSEDGSHCWLSAEILGLLRLAHSANVSNAHRLDGSEFKARDGWLPRPRVMIPMLQAMVDKSNREQAEHDKRTLTRHYHDTDSRMVLERYREIGVTPVRYPPATSGVTSGAAGAPPVAPLGPAPATFHGEAPPSFAGGIYGRGPSRAGPYALESRRVPPLPPLPPLPPPPPELFPVRGRGLGRGRGRGLGRGRGGAQEPRVRRQRPIPSLENMFDALALPQAQEVPDLGAVELEDLGLAPLGAGGPLELADL